jgi:hypothetical protein
MKFADNELFLMVNVGGRLSGLPMNIWNGRGGHAQHLARIKVQMDNREPFDIRNLASVGVEDTPPEVKEGRRDAHELELVRRYVALNKQAILDHWHERTDASSFPAQ